MTIYKFPLNIASSQLIDTPPVLRMLSVQEQNGSLCMWAVVDDNAPMTKRRILIYGTGHRLDLAFPPTFIATVQVGAYVWHVFDAGEVS